MNEQETEIEELKKDVLYWSRRARAAELELSRWRFDAGEET